jgi:proteasome lid subunit RPN8/RPN11
VRIGADLLDEIVAHAREEAPNECCGVLTGRDGRATSLTRTRNRFESPVRYEVHPDDLYAVYSDAEGRGAAIVAFYHSHVKVPAYPSETDINLAWRWPESLQLICSLADPDPEVRAFAIRDRAVEEVELVVDD